MTDEAPHSMESREGIHMHTYLHVCMRAYMTVFLHTPTRMHRYSFYVSKRVLVVYVCMHAHTFISEYALKCVCLYECVYVYV